LVKNGQKAWLCAQTVVILHRQKEKKVSQDKRSAEKDQHERDQFRYWPRLKRVFQQDDKTYSIE